MANYVVTDTELTNVANSIREKGGTTESLSWPNGYITAVEDITVGGEDIYAAITVIYPPGRFCTATNGNITLTAKNTNGNVVFGIPEPTLVPETWTINCYDINGENDIFSLNINYYGQNENVFFKNADPILDNNDWNKINNVAQSGQGDTYWDIGDCKKIIINGTIGDQTQIFTNYTTYIYIIDFNHPINKTTPDNNIIFGGFKTALTNGKDIILCGYGYNSYVSNGARYFSFNHFGSSSVPYNTNYGGWKGCDFRYDILGTTSTPPTYYGRQKQSSNIGYDATNTTITSPVANTLMAALPNDMRSVLKLWNRYIDFKGNASNIDANCSSPTIDAGISVLAEFEIFGIRTYANQYEQNHQKQMAYYSAGNNKIKYNHSNQNSACRYQLSSPVYNDDFSFLRVETNGTVSYNASRSIFGITPIFKI